MLARLFDGPKGGFVIFDYLISLLAVFGNLIVLDAICRSHFSLKGYRRFLISLSLSDLFMCLVNVLLFVFQISPFFESDSQFFRSLQLVGFTSNLLNLCGMSTDHAIGLLYPLKYNYVSHPFLHVSFF